MVACMPRWALPRNHKKHPSGLCKFQNARKSLNQQLEDLHARIKQFFASNESVWNCIGSRFYWLASGYAHNHEKDLLCVKDSIKDEIETMVTSFVALRSLQRQVNQIRKILAERDVKDICCCKKNSFICEMHSYLDIVIGNSMNAFDCRSIAIENSMSKGPLITPEARSDFWKQIGHLDRDKLEQTDRITFRYRKMLDSQHIQDKLEALELFISYICAGNKESEHFERRKMCLVLQQYSLYQEIYVCALALTTGDLRHWNADHCDHEDCDFHAFVNNAHFYNPALPLIKEDNFEALVDFASSSLLSGSTQFVSLAQLGMATARYLEAASDLYGMNSRTICEVIDLLGDTCFSHAEQTIEVEDEEVSKEDYGEFSNLSQLDEVIKISQSANQALDTVSCEALDRKHVQIEDRLKPEHECFGAAIPLPSTAVHGCSRKRYRPESPDSLSCCSRRKVSKYRHRGYKAPTVHVCQPKITAESNIHQRVWIVPDRAHYQKVWRVIFPVTRSDRQVSRVPWTLFVQAIQSPPVNCRVKKAEGVIFVFERRNESGGKEIFQCHAPHQMDWICQGDLYRYRKDLRDAFGMGAERIMLQEKPFGGS